MLLLCVVALRAYSIFEEFLIVDSILNLTLASLTVLISLQCHALSRLISTPNILLSQGTPHMVIDSMIVKRFGMDLILHLSMHTGLIWFIFISIQSHVVNRQVLIILKPRRTLTVVPIMIVRHHLQLVLLLLDLWITQLNIPILIVIEKALPTRCIHHLVCICHLYFSYLFYLSIYSYESLLLYVCGFY